ncbi:hypothetical protein ABFS83_06G043600 [Erythranthe nasuta]
MACRESVEVDEFGDRHFSGGVGLVISYDGDPASCNPIRLKKLEVYAESDILMSTTKHMHLIKKTLTFRAKVSITGHYVEDVEFYPGRMNFGLRNRRRILPKTFQRIDCSV